MAGPGYKTKSNLRDVARLANVSVATVSRVLNRPEVVTPDTLARVNQAMDELKFIPSAAARSINSGRTRLVGALVPTLDNAIFARYLEGLESRLSESGLSLIVATTDNDPEREAEKAKQLVNIGVEALAVSGVHHSEAFLAQIDRAQMPVIAISYFDPEYHLPTVGYDNQEGAALAMQHLLSLGHRQIAVIHGTLHNNDRQVARLDGVMQAHAAAEPAHSRVDCFEDELTIEGGCRAIEAMLKSGQTYTAVLCLTDVLATGALYELQRNGLNIPKDLSLVGMEDMPSSSMTAPRLTTIRFPILEMGEQTAMAIAGWLEHNQKPEPIYLASELIVRETTAAVNVDSTGV